MIERLALTHGAGKKVGEHLHRCGNCTIQPFPTIMGSAFTHGFLKLRSALRDDERVHAGLFVFAMNIRPNGIVRASSDCIMSLNCP